MKTLPFVLFLLPIMLLTACDDDQPSGSEYNGFYQVTLYQERAACDDGSAWLDTDPVDKYFDQLDCVGMSRLEATRL